MLSSPLLLLSLLTTVQAVSELKLGRTALSGREVSPRVEFYGGIPFAEPPVGALRLRPPVLRSRLNASRFDASEYGKACVQPLSDPSTLSEDCLTINVHRPKGLKPSAKLPVLFWTYGGSFSVGSSNTFNGSEIVERSVARGTPIIFVNFNYRVGPLGFPQGQEADDLRSLNLGILDQMAALEWVQENIKSFGGDKKKVTIFGESAGSIMSGILLLQPEVERWARGAIMQSGSPNSLPVFRASRNELAWQQFVGNVASCAYTATSGHTFPCLRNATTEEITTGLTRSVMEENLFSNFVWTPALDTRPGSVYPDLSSRLYSKGQFARIPFIAGTNLDEGTFFASHESLSTQALKNNILAVTSPRSGSDDALGTAVDQVLTLYPEDPSVGSPYGTGDELFDLPPSYKRHASIFGDLVFDAPRRMLSEAASKAGVKFYSYLFTHPQPQLPMGVFHSSEIQFVFGQVPLTGPNNLPPIPLYGEADEAARNVSTIMMDYWISFAVSLNPNDGKGIQRPHWPQYTPLERVMMQLRGGNTTIIQDDYRKKQIAFFHENAAVFQR
ncbi:hypothetical protein EST38_g10579 [Candolleomyces aberdarensis]|uniref:Carboxylic ester hydrolase n=1 Tax=Candolleomyces aberdarensis TaxID=2316362 RepID=A0A4V1Q2J1_9AGAR|nr:hypothetical protein EST38_g10579 [Candolleomyces aberdarensis]